MQLFRLTRVAVSRFQSLQNGLYKQPAGFVVASLRAMAETVEHRRRTMELQFRGTTIWSFSLWWLEPLEKLLKFLYEKCVFFSMKK